MSESLNDSQKDRQITDLQRKVATLGTKNAHLESELRGLRDKQKATGSSKSKKRKAKAPAGPSSPSKCGDLSIQQRTSKHADLTTQQRRDIFYRWLNKKKSGETDEDLARAFDIARRTVVDVCGSIKAKLSALDGENANFSGRVEEITVEAVMKLPDHHHVFQNNRKGNTGGARQSTKPRKARKPTKPSQEEVNGTLQWLQTLRDNREEDWCQNRKLPRDTLATLDKIHGLSLKQLRGTEEQLATDLGVELPTLRKFCFSHYASNLAQKRKEQQDLETKAAREEEAKKRAAFQKKQGRIVPSRTIAIPDHHPCITEVNHPCITEVNRSDMPCDKRGEWPSHSLQNLMAEVVAQSEDLAVKAVQHSAKMSAISAKLTDMLHHPCITEVNGSDMPCDKRGEWPSHSLQKLMAEVTAQSEDLAVKAVQHSAKLRDILQGFMEG